MNKLAQISLIAGTAGLATAGSLDMDRSYAAELRSDSAARDLLNSNAGAGVQVDVAMRFYYGLNFRDDAGLPNPDDDTTIGFGWDDAEVRLSGDITDNMRGTISWDFGPADYPGAGAVALEDAFADWTVNDSLTLRVGQFNPQFSAERNTSEYHMLGAMRSVTFDTVGNPTWTQGIEAHFGGDTWSAAVGFNDGPGAGPGGFNASGDADYAFNARFDIFSDSDKARFADQTSWRGSAAGWRVGAGLIYATYGDTNPSGTSLESDSLWYTIDGAYEGDGWSVRAAFYGANTDPNVGNSTDDYGFEIGASMFFNDQWEGFLRWDTLMLDDVNLVATSEDTYNFLSGGFNYYFVPESHAAKFTFSVAYAFDATTGAEGAFDDPGFAAPTGMAPFGSSGFLGSQDDGELMITALMSLMF